MLLNSLFRNQVPIISQVHLYLPILSFLNNCSISDLSAQPCILTSFPSFFPSFLSSLDMTFSILMDRKRDEKNKQKTTRVSPSKLPFSPQNASSFSCVSLDGLKTNTPELKQSGQPGSGAADSSSRSKSSSIFDRT